MKTYLIPSLKITFLTILLFGAIYPLAITGIATLIAPNGGGGKIIEVNGKVVGFDLIGQSFISDKYFNSRPSAIDYNAASTGGSNKGPVNPEYLKEVKGRIENFLKQNPDIKRNDITVDLVTASGSGIDPHISPRAAEIQIPRIANVRHMPEADVRALVKRFTEEPLFGILGPSRVHVLKLNIALDNINSH